MKKIKIPLEILYKLFNNKIEKVYTSNADLKADQIIEQNKKYFNHIGVAWFSYNILQVYKVRTAIIFKTRKDYCTILKWE